MSRRRPRVPGSRYARRAALCGLDGGPQLRAALDEMRRRQPGHDVVVVNNGDRGPAIVDTRGVEPGGWVVEGLIPSGAIAAICDLDDPSPATLLEGGFDAVILLGLRGAPVPGRPIRVSAYFHARLGLEPPQPFRVRFDPARGDFVPVDDESEEAA